MSSTSSSSQIKTSEGVVSTDPDILIHRPIKKELSPAEQAAKMGMYGGLTRTIEEFWPTRLLCKRFNVKVPKHVESTTKSESGVASSQPDAAAVVAQKSLQGFGGTLPGPMKVPKELVSTAEITEMIREVKGDATFELPVAVGAVAQVDVERNEALEGERAADDVFKAIFGESDDSDDDGGN